MVLPAGVDTPRTEVGNGTFFSNPDLEFSIEQSFQSPSKELNGIIQSLQNGRKSTLITPGARRPLAESRNFGGKASHGEFTPLLKSVAKSNMMRRQNKDPGLLETPAFLKAGYQTNNPSPALPVESSALYDGGTGTFLDGGDPDKTPVPRASSSSANSTPLASLPKSSGGGVVTTDGQNVMTLREQENIINKVEKENFGLKLKIHFLEEALRRAGPGISEAALKENTDLKVDKVTLQRELQQYRKTLVSAENELDKYRQQLAKAQEKTLQKHATEEQREEISRLRQTLHETEAKVESLEGQVRSMEDSEGGEQALRDEVNDLEMDLREKERLIETKDDELNELRDELDRANTKADLLEHELNCANDDGGAVAQGLRDGIIELEAGLRDKTRQVVAKDDELNHCKNDLLQADTKITDLEHELRSSSLHTQELERQVSALRNDLQHRIEEKNLLQSRHDTLTSESKDLQRELSKAQGVISELEHHHASQRQLSAHEEAMQNDNKAEIRRLYDEINDLQRELEKKNRKAIDEKESWERERRNLQSQLQKIEGEASGLARTVQILEETKGSSSERESRLKHAFEQEKQRHATEEANLTRRIKELNDEVSASRHVADDLKTEFKTLQVKVRASEQEKKALDEKVQGLEDEVFMMQNMLDEENEQAKKEIETAQQEIDDLKAKLQSILKERDGNKRYLQSYKEMEAHSDEYKKERDLLQKEVLDLQEHNEMQLKNKLAVEKTSSELRAKIRQLEKDLRDARLDNENRTLVRERKDLHEMLKDAKLKVEELEITLSHRESRIESLKQREKDLRSQLKKAREEGALQAQKTSIAINELDAVRGRHERAISKAATAEHDLAKERKALQKSVLDKDKQHSAEIRGLVKQIGYMRKKCEREQRFRGDLTFMKKYFLMQIDLYTKCNYADLQIIEAMGVRPAPLIEEKRRPSIRKVAFAVIAISRMRKFQAEWAQNVQVKEKLIASLGRTKGRPPRAVGL